MPSETAAELAARKAALRPEAQQRRAEVAAANPAAGAELRDTFLDSIALPAGAPVSGYWPSRTELDLRPLLTALAGRGHAVGLPVVVEKAAPLLFRRWQPGDRLELGAFRIEIPSADQPEVVPRVLLVPLLAFDRGGYRLGYGGGFYDRTLEKLRRLAPGGGPPLAVGVAFAGQEVEAVPRDRLDARLDWIVTEREALCFA